MSDCSDKPKCDKGRRIAIVVLYILIAVLYGWVSYICYCDLNFDANNSAGIFISVLGILVAILMGWQVVNAIANTKTLRRIYTLKKELTAYREQARQDAVDNYLHSQALKMIDEAKDKNNGMSNRYWSGLNAIKNLLCGLTPTNYIPMLDALLTTENILKELKDTKDEAWRYMFLEHQQTYESLYDEMISALQTKAKHLEYLKDRIKKIRDERVSILTPYQGKTWDDYAEYIRKKKAEATPPIPN